MDELSLTHCKYECKYHIVFAPKFRRQAIYGKLKAEIGKILRRLCEYKKIEFWKQTRVQTTHFWCKGYYVSTVGRNEKKIAEYIQNQLQEDIANEQLTMKEYIDPFGEEGKK